MLLQVGANAHSQVTKVSSLGMWVPVHDEEWDGDIPLDLHRPNRPDVDSEGEVVFQADKLPWQCGTYEVNQLCSRTSAISNPSAQIRYHHAGKYNVMSMVGPIKIFGMYLWYLPRRYDSPCITVDKPATLDFQSVRSSLARIVPLCLDSDPSLIPLSCKASEDGITEVDGRDPDDFRFWSESQAKRISKAIVQAFGVELTREVIIADANLGALANRILVSRDLLSQ